MSFFTLWGHHLITRGLPYLGGHTVATEVLCFDSRPFRERIVGSSRCAAVVRLSVEITGVKARPQGGGGHSSASSLVLGIKFKILAGPRSKFKCPG